MLTLHEECRDGNAAAIAQLLDGGADVEAKGDIGARPTVGDVVRIVGGEGKGSVTTVTCDDGSNWVPLQLQGRPGLYNVDQCLVHVTALTAAACGGHVEAVRLLLARGAKADGASGAEALRFAKCGEMKALLRAAGAAE
jgi:hypothetical protein